jgi:5-methylcytosine-specific restriction endonuclease McrA
MILIGEKPRMSPEAARRLELLLDSATCAICNEDQCRLTRRSVANYVAIYLQCVNCGAALGPAQPRGEHWHWQSYPLWDDGLADDYHQNRRQQFEADLAERERSRRAEYEERSVRYGEWLRTSPEWRVLRLAVLRRSNGLCEVCPEARRAEHVHHQTYGLGLLPPLPMLWAVCRECHERLHADRFGREDEWCPNSLLGRRDAAE